MTNKSQKTSLIILAITAAVCSKALFALFDDPEGPNLLVVTVGAVIIYAVSLTVYFFYPSTQRDSPTRIAVLVLIQALVVAGLYFALN